MSLENVDFSDLILFSDGTAKLKGSPGSGSHLVELPEDCISETQDLLKILGKLNQSAIRLRHNGISYRVARIDDVESQRTWFLRRLANTVPMFSELNLNPVVVGWLLKQKQGLVLVAGAQGSGKTTTASGLVAEKLTLDGGHGVAFENPAELPLAGPWGKYGYCFQTEIESEADLAQAIERAHRYASPDIIFIGEIRTKHAALEALRISLGSSRQLVIATIHGLDVATALERLITWARELDGESACQNLADALVAILYLTLERDGSGKTNLSSPQYLLIPFKEESKGIRSKLRDGKFNALADDMRQIKGKIINKKELWDE